MTSAVQNAAQEVLRTVLGDEAWQDMGFAKRPQYGAVVQRLRTQWKVRLEKSVIQEMVSILTAAHLIAKTITPPELEQLLNVFVDGTDTSGPLWEALGYGSRKEAEAHLKASINDYATTSISEWPRLLCSRLNVAEIPDGALRGKLIVGSVRFGQLAEDMVQILQRRTG